MVEFEEGSRPSFVLDHLKENPPGRVARLSDYARGVGSCPAQERMDQADLDVCEF